MLHRIDVVVRSARSKHVMNDYCPNILDEFNRVNVQGIVNLTHYAAVTDVKHSF